MSHIYFIDNVIRDEFNVYERRDEDVANYFDCYFIIEVT